MSYQTPYEFSEQLIKGRIAEMVFEQMLRESGAFTVLEFGYEKVIPELARLAKNNGNEETLEIVRRAPDFAVINHESKQVHLIEVKYMHAKTKGKVLRAAENMIASWNPSSLFIATPEGFYFDHADRVIAQCGQIKPLHHRDLPQELQQRYLQLLNDFMSGVVSP